MERMEFINKLFDLYSNSWNDKNKDIKQEQYFTILNRSNIDYNKLMQVINEENYNEFMPTPAWIKEKLPKCLIKGTAKKWINVEVYNPISKANTNCDCFPLGTSIEQMIKSYEKKFNCTGWKIIKVY